MLILIGFSDEEQRVIKEAASRFDILSSCHFVKQLDETDAYLGMVQKDQMGIEYPDFAILNCDNDINFRLLWSIKSHSSIRFVPIIGFGTVLDRRKINKFYNLGGNSYIKKPETFEEMMDTASTLLHFWRRMSQLPSRCA